MRIIAGRNKGRVLAAPPGSATRPTADRVREALFNILAHGATELARAAVLDAFAGSGALGLEALSRGAARVTFLETDPQAAAVIEANLRKLGAGSQAVLLKADATRPPRAAAPATLVMMDPPYKSGLATLALPALATAGWLADETLVVVEVAAGEPLKSPLPGWAVTDERTYGAARLVFIRKQP
ncbi:MAG TPA: 16S rRNA (guanine(966)-N(2))-methyltransferase RsmD [Rhodospirillaceae bacterium]|nr:16S rRNA (guanine(966)-N(2))-methyltransferase RsmD [Rhodospirillaceae bacterium]